LIPLIPLYVVLFDRWWNPAVEEQAIHRAHRFGRDRPLHVIRFLIRETVEERIEAILVGKRQLFDDYVHDVSKEGVGSFTRDDLRKVLDLKGASIDRTILTG
jgi:SNF2 family DNA or RNA helicase